MKTAQEKYLNDPAYRLLVDTLISLIEKGEYTPSELREAVIFAATKYEMTHLRDHIVIPDGSGLIPSG